MKNEENRASVYELAYRSDYGFEGTQVRFRQELLLQRLDELLPQVVVEVGCGGSLLYERWISQGHSADCWVVVEPASGFAEMARQSMLSNLRVIEDFLEPATDRIRTVLPRAPDMVICASLLHEVPDVQRFLAGLSEIMDERTVLHVNVPNSESFHRLLAVSMGLIPDTKRLSDRNALLSQPRVYDAVTLEKDLAAAGFEICNRGGYLMKPFTHAQMERIKEIMGHEVLDGLFRLGQQLPSLASEIFVEARRSQR